MKSDDPRLLPPMSMLRCFDAAVRHGGFSRAAEELGISQSGVSRQIANLEAWLGVSLFVRYGRRVVASEQGELFRAQIEPALSAIRSAVGRLIDPMQDRVIELATLPSFGMRWLAPRLSTLSLDYPDLVVNIIARSDIFDFAGTNFTAAIHVGPAKWPGVCQDYLFRETVVPVVSSAVAAGARLSCAADFQRLPLLVQSERRDAWERWFALQDVRHAPHVAYQVISHFLMLAQAVGAGAGAALLPSFLIEPELRAGTLVAPLDLPLLEERDYYLVYPEAKMKMPAFRMFRDWMLRQAVSPDGERGPSV